MVLNGLQCSQMILNGLKIDHTFNWMVFITRFNLVLVWSKIVQIFTKKSSKWVRQNQVSWSSFHNVHIDHNIHNYHNVCNVDNVHDIHNIHNVHNGKNIPNIHNAPNVNNDHTVHKIL